MRRLTAILAGLVLSSCSLQRPYGRDTTAYTITRDMIGAAVCSGLAVAQATTYANSGPREPITKNPVAISSVIAFAACGLLYSAAAIYGINKEPADTHKTNP